MEEQEAAEGADQDGENDADAEDPAESALEGFIHCGVTGGWIGAGRGIVQRAFGHGYSLPMTPW